MHKRLVIVVLVALLTVSLGACGGADPTAVTTPTSATPRMILASTYQFHRDYCLPWLNVENKIAEVFINYVEENPQYYNKPAIFNLFYALSDAYPCPAPKTNPGK